jgi:hypothetical protein
MIGFAGMIRRRGEIDAETRGRFARFVARGGASAAAGKGRSRIDALAPDPRSCEGPHHLLGTLALHSDQCQLRTFPDGVSVGLTGEIFNDLEPGEDGLDLIHRRYLRDDIAAFADLNGSFALVLLEPNRDRFLIATDRLASRAVMYAAGPEQVLFAPDLRCFTGEVSAELEPTAVAAMLSSGQLYHDDTWFRAVKYLQGGRALEVSRESVEVREYWDYRLEPGPDEGELTYAKRLEPLLIQAVERRTRGRSGAVLMLSGGKDSRAILGICQLLGRRVLLGSYFLHDPPGSDPAVARQLADMTGMPLLALPYPPPDSIAALRESIPYHGGMRDWIYEIDALRKLEGVTGTVIAGDESFGWKAGELADEESVLRIIDIHRLANQPLWRTFLKPEVYEQLAEADRASFQRFAAGSSLANPHDRKDYFYTTERLVRRVLPSRSYLHTLVALRNPWLDNDVLEFIRRLPVEHRIGKALFSSTVRRMFPRLFSVPLADSTGAYDQASLRLELCQRRDSLSFLSFGTEPIDTLFEPGAIERDLLSEDALTRGLESNPWKRYPVDWMQRAVRQVTHRSVARAPATWGIHGKVPLLKVFSRIQILRYMAGEVLQLRL